MCNLLHILTLPLPAQLPASALMHVLTALSVTKLPWNDVKGFLIFRHTSAFLQQIFGGQVKLVSLELHDIMLGLVCIN